MPSSPKHQRGLHLPDRHPTCAVWCQQIMKATRVATTFSHCGAAHKPKAGGRAEAVRINELASKFLSVSSLVAGSLC
jgi:hypothetical protein